jgi:RNA polymerase sigma-70 factor (ECF subfamily)
VETSNSELGLVESARAGDRKALEKLLERYQGHIYRFGMKMCGDPEDAKDVLQETMLAVARNVQDFRGGSSVTTWLYTIARSFCIKKRRRSKFAPEREESLDADREGEVRAVPDSARGPEDELAGRQIEEALERAIGSLAPMYREVLVLRDVEGLSAPEVGEVLGLTVEAVKSRLHRARLSVRSQVAPLLGGVPQSGPTCPPVVELLSRHMEGEISADLCAQMEQHVASCPGCQGACDSLRKTLALCRSSPEPRLPSSVQRSVRSAIEAFVKKGS